MPLNSCWIALQLFNTMSKLKKFKHNERERNMSDVQSKIVAIVAEQLGVDESKCTNEASFIDDLGADSLDTVELVMALEEAFETEIPDEEAEKITTVQAAIDYVNANS